MSNIRSHLATSELYSQPCARQFSRLSYTSHVAGSRPIPCTSGGPAGRDARLVNLTGGAVA